MFCRVASGPHTRTFRDGENPSSEKLFVRLGNPVTSGRIARETRWQSLSFFPGRVFEQLEIIALMR